MPVPASARRNLSVCSEGEDPPEAYSLAAVHWHRRWRRRLRNGIALRPRLYLALARRGGKDGLVDRSTELVIEGFPRCANSFAEAAFRLAQERPVRLAHHAHAAAHVLVAVEAGVPTLVLVRDPDQAVPSRIARDPDIYRPEDGYREFIAFYRRIRPAATGFVAADFAQITADFGAVIRRINERFGTAFAEFASSPENVRRAYGLIDELALHRLGRIALYSSRHDERFRHRLARLQASVREEVAKPKYDKIRTEARAVYRDFADLAAEPAAN
jgi:hypothetical protein